MQWGRILAGLIAFILVTVTRAADIELSNSSSRIWEHSLGEGFKENTFQIGASASGGFGVRVFGGSVIHNFALANVNAGWIFTDVQLPETCLRGNWELRSEIFAGEELRAQRYVAGVTFPAFRYHLATGTRLAPYIHFGAGGTTTNIKGPDLSRGFQFNLEGGAGLNYFVTKQVALSAEYRFFHLSNAGFAYPNRGVNAHLFCGGISYWF